MLFLIRDEVASQTPFIPFPDSTFSTSGLLYIRRISNFEPLHMATQSDGKILIAGYGWEYLHDDNDAVVYRVHSNGTLDSTFGVSGMLRMDFAGAIDNCADIRILADGKILLLLDSNSKIMFARLNPDGTFDNTFGNNGIKLGYTGTNIYSACMAVQSDQKIIVAGREQVTSDRTKGFVRRFNPDGSPDTGYGTNGYVSVDIDPNKALDLRKCLLQPDGKFVATGPFGGPEDSGFPAVRLNIDGSFDSTFGDDGIFYQPFNNPIIPAEANAIALDKAGNILVGGISPVGDLAPMTAISIKPDGTLNAAFGSSGIVYVPYYPYASAWKINIQPDNKILLSGYYFNTPDSTEIAIARLLPDGQPDNTFGTDGRYSLSVKDDYKVQSIEDSELTDDGKIISAIWVQTSFNNAIAGVYSACYVSRFIVDITVRATEPSLVFLDATVSPNILTEGQQAHISYTLEKSCRVTIELYDQNGRQIATLAPAQLRDAGEQNEKVTLPAGSAPGIYYAVLSTDQGFKALRLIRQ